jgi:Holliday junction resolvase RusA-like endonuclease
MTERVLDVWVAHEPQQVGSKNAFPVYENPREPNPWKRRPKRNPGGGIIITVTDENAKAKPFIRAAARAARAAYGEPAEADFPFELDVTFHVHRPLGHWGTGRNAHLLKDSAPARPTTMPDEDKLLRAAQDALGGIVWDNDSQVVRAVAFKVYAGYDEHGVEQLGARFVVRRHPFVTAADLPLEERTRGVPAVEGDASGDQTSLGLVA